MKVLRVLFLLAFTILFVSGTAVALPYNTRPVTLAPEDFAAQYPAEASLQTVLNTVLDNNVPDVTDDQRPDAYWMATDSGAHAYGITMFTSVSGTFGVYSPFTGDTVDLMSLTAPSDDPNAGGTNGFSPELVRNFYVNGSGELRLDSPFGGDPDGTGFQAFGFYWQTNSHIFYTDDSLNSPASNTDIGVIDRTARALAFLLDPATTGDLNAYNPADQENPDVIPLVADGDDWILAFEDGSDFDYNDAVFFVEDIIPIPEPGTLMLLGLGLVGLAGYGRRKIRIG